VTDRDPECHARGRKDPARARHLLDRVGLGHRLTHKPTALSVGEQQRVAVARALANKPSLLLADEPTANIDPRNQQKIIELIRDTCREEGVSLVLVTHSPEVAGQFQRVDKLEEINVVNGEAAKP
jgi:putative ABC transport system ATP-binding protein